MKKSVKILILALFLVIIGLITYIVVDKVTSTKEDNSNVVANTATDVGNNDTNVSSKENGIQKSDYIGEWNNDENTQLIINNDGTFQADHYTASSTIYGDYTIDGENIEFICKKNDETYNKKWNGIIIKDKNGDFELKVNLYDEETTLKKYNQITENSNKDSSVEGTDYQKYIGTWADDITNADEFEIKSIENGKITFTWFFYRLASIDDQTLNLDGNKCEFYYKTYVDLNNDGDDTEEEIQIRKATIELQENKIHATITDIDKIGDGITLIEFPGSVYIHPGVYEYKIKIN